MCACHWSRLMVPVSDRYGHATCPSSRTPSPPFASDHPCSMEGQTPCRLADRHSMVSRELPRVTHTPGFPLSHLLPKAVAAMLNARVVIRTISRLESNRLGNGRGDGWSRRARALRRASIPFDAPWRSAGTLIPAAVLRRVEKCATGMRPRRRVAGFSEWRAAWSDYPPYRHQHKMNRTSQRDTSRSRGATSVGRQTKRHWARY